MIKTETYFIGEREFTSNYLVDRLLKKEEKWQII